MSRSTLTLCIIRVKKNRSDRLIPPKHLNMFSKKFSEFGTLFYIRFLFQSYTPEPYQVKNELPLLHSNLVAKNCSKKKLEEINLAFIRQIHKNIQKSRTTYILIYLIAYLHPITPTSSLSALTFFGKSIHIRIVHT